MARIIDDDILIQCKLKFKNTLGVRFKLHITSRSHCRQQSYRLFLCSDSSREVDSPPLDPDEQLDGSDSMPPLTISV